MRNFTLGLVLALTMALGFFASASPAQANETYHGFAKQKHYVSAGGEPASLEQAGIEPMSVFRSAAAYAAFRAHFGSFEAGRPYTDEETRELFLSPRMRLIDCVGSINTAGITNSGRVGFSNRGCYSNAKYGVEQLIQFQLEDGRWVTIASLWCFNPVKGKLPEPLVSKKRVAILPTEPVLIDYSIKGSTTVFQTKDLFLGGTVSQIGCPECCIEYVFTPAIFISGTDSSVRYEN